MESRAKSAMFPRREMHNSDAQTCQRTTNKQQRIQQRCGQSCRAGRIKFEEKRRLKINGLTEINQVNTSQEKYDSHVPDSNTYHKIQYLREFSIGTNVNKHTNGIKWETWKQPNMYTVTWLEAKVLPQEQERMYSPSYIHNMYV